MIWFMELHLSHYEAPLSVMELHDWSFHGAPHIIMELHDYGIVSPVALHMITQKAYLLLNRVVFDDEK